MRRFATTTTARLVSAPLPLHKTQDGREFDATYVTNRATAADMYFEIKAGQRPWVASLDKQGRGLIQASTGRCAGERCGPGARVAAAGGGRTF